MKKPFVIPIDVGDMEWDHSEAVYRQGIGTKVAGGSLFAGTWGNECSHFG